MLKNTFGGDVPLKPASKQLLRMVQEVGFKRKPANGTTRRGFRRAQLLPSCSNIGFLPLLNVYVCVCVCLLVSINKTGGGEAVQGQHASIAAGTQAAQKRGIVIIFWNCGYIASAMGCIHPAQDHKPNAFFVQPLPSSPGNKMSACQRLQTSTV